MITPVIKLVEFCNLGCTYCYQAESVPSRQRVMADETLQRVLSELRTVRRGSVSILWYGGEPTLVGKESFQRAVRLADSVLGRDMVVHYLQTNGVLLDEEWAELLGARKFRVTLSLDGPEDLHDPVRPFRDGKGSHRAVVRGLRVLRSRGVPLRVSCVVASHTVAHPEALMDYFGELGVPEVDFPPALRIREGKPEPLVGSRDYGEFMARVFDHWLARGPAVPRVRSLSGLVRSLAGRASGFCKLEGRCTRFLTFGWDGSVYPCDEFSGLADYRLGNVHQEPLQSILTSTRARQAWQSWQSVPEPCRACRWSRLCRGGCPFERRMAGGVDRPSLLCEGLQILYERVEQSTAVSRVCLNLLKK